jgi:hypothetical protein
VTAPSTTGSPHSRAGITVVVVTLLVGVEFVEVVSVEVVVGGNVVVVVLVVLVVGTVVELVDEVLVVVPLCGADVFSNLRR